MLSSALKQELRASILLSVPLAAAQIAQAATGFVDTVMMGWMGPKSLAAGGLGAALASLLLVTGFGLTTSVTALGAEAIGSQDRDRLSQVTIQGFIFCLGVSLLAAACLTSGEFILRWSGQSLQTAHLAQSYLYPIAGGYFPALAFVMLRGIVSAIGSPRLPMGIALVGLGINAIGNYVLGFGKWGAPPLGLAGLAIATSGTQWFMLISLIIAIQSLPKLRSFGLFDRAMLPWTAGQAWINGKLLTELIQLGWPTGLSFAAEVGLFSVTTILMGRLGTEVLAAHQVVFQTIAIMFMLPLGVSYATTIRVGQGVGEGNFPAIRRSAMVGMILGGSIMALNAWVILTVPRSVIGLYLDLSNPAHQALVPIATSMFVIAAIAQILDGIQTTAAGALRGLQDTRIPMLISFVTFWGLGLASGIALGFGLGWGGVGLWMGQSIGILAACVGFVWRIVHLTRLS